MADQIIRSIIYLMKKLLVFTILALFSLPISTKAFSIEYGPNVNITKENIFEENLYILSGDVQFDTTLENDLIILSRKTNLDGAFFGDIQNISTEVTFTGEAFGDTRLVGGNVFVSGITNKDLVGVAGNFVLEDTAILNGKSLIIGNDVELRGRILDDVKIIANKVKIDSEILGDVEITAQNISFGDNANISGEVVYYSPKSADIYSNAVFNTVPVHNQIKSIDETDIIKSTVINFISFWTIIKFLSTLFTAFILVFIFRIFSQRVSYFSTEEIGKTILIGVLTIPVGILSVFIFMTSLFGIPVAFVSGFFLVTLLLLAPAVSGIIAGYLIRRYIDKKKRPQVDFNSTALGIIILTFLYFIPIFGSLLKFILTVLALGSMVMYCFEVITIKKPKQK